MAIISFAWTTDALLAGRKTCTCRDWSADYAAKFKAGDLVAAYDRSPRFKGQQIATIRLTHPPTFGTLTQVLGSFGAAYEAEGFAYYDEQVEAGNDKIRKAIEKNLGVEPGTTLYEWLHMTSGWGEWVIRFEVVEFVK